MKIVYTNQWYKDVNYSVFASDIGLSVDKKHRYSRYRIYTVVDQKLFFISVIKYGIAYKEVV